MALESKSLRTARFSCFSSSSSHDTDPHSESHHHLSSSYLLSTLTTEPSTTHNTSHSTKHNIKPPPLPALHSEIPHISVGLVLTSFLGSSLSNAVANFHPSHNSLVPPQPNNSPIFHRTHTPPPGSAKMSQPNFEKGSPRADPPASPLSFSERYPARSSPPSLTPDREETDNPSVTLPQPGGPAYAPVSPVTPPLPPSDYTPIAFAYVHPSVNPNFTTDTADPPRRTPRRKLPNGPCPRPRSGVKPVSGWKPASGLKSKPTAVIESMIASASQSTSTTFVKSEKSEKSESFAAVKSEPVDVVMSEKTPQPSPVAEKAPMAEPTPIAQPTPIAPGAIPACTKQEPTQDANEGLLHATATNLTVLNGPAPNLQPVANPENSSVNHYEAGSSDFDFDFDCTCKGTICYGECRQEPPAPAPVMDVSNLPAMGANNLPAWATHSHAGMGVNTAPAVAVHNLPFMAVPPVPVVAVTQAPDRRYLPGLGMNGPRDQTEEVREYFAANFVRHIPRRPTEWIWTWYFLLWCQKMARLLDLYIGTQSIGILRTLSLLST